MGSNDQIIERAFSNHGCALVFSTNELFAPYLAVMIQSVIDRASDDRRYDMVILTADMKESTFDKIAALAKGRANISIRRFDVAHLIEGIDLFTENNPNLSIESYFRLLTPDLFSRYDRAIYLDGDMIARVDVARLYDIPFDGKALMSTRDLWGTCNCYMEDDPLREYREELLDDSDVDDYFIAGLIVFNIPLLADYHAERMLEIAASREWRQHDQDILNRLFRGNVKLIPACWDYMHDKYETIKYLPAPLREEYREADADPAIVHFGGHRKPWENVYMEYDLLFWEAADRTPFFDEIFFGMFGKLEYKAYILRHLGKGSPVSSVKRNDVYFYFDDRYVGRFSSRAVQFDFLCMRNGRLEAEGYVPKLGLADQDDLKIFLRQGDELFESEVFERYVEFYRTQGDLKWKGQAFRFSIPLDSFPESANLSILCSVNGVPIAMKNLRFGKFCAVGDEFENGYQYACNRIMQSRGQSIVITKATYEDAQKLEESFQSELFLHEDGDEAVRLRREARSGKPQKEIWLFSDRADKADDNGEAMFRYVCENMPDVDAYFIVREDSPDYSRLAEVGNVVPFLSEEHKRLHLLCSYNLSAQADLQSFNPFKEDYAPFRDLLQSQKFVFLQHGVIKNDISRWFNRTNINPWIFVTSAARERESIVTTKKYNLDESIVKLTGLPRHDLLYNDSSRLITIMPTWRIWLSERPASNNGIWTVRPGFENSPYFLFYNALLNDTRLLEAARSYGYTICFMPHPNIQDGLDFFEKPDEVVFFDTSKRYSEVFAESDLVVTDYSSSVMDFAYLRKPIVYTHFDEDEFFNGVHIASRGYFDDERDGFGRVTRTKDELVDAIIAAMESGCELEDRYRERIDDFFAFRDRGARARIIEEIRLKENEDDFPGEPSKVASFEFVQPLPDPPSSSGGARSVILRPRIEKACRNLGFSCDRRYTLDGILGRPRYWATDSDIRQSIEKAVPTCAGSELESSFHAPEFCDFETSDIEARFINHIGAQVSGAVPCSSSDWASEIDRTAVGLGWRVVAECGRFDDYQSGDIVSFANGKKAMVLSSNGKRVIFITCRQRRGACAVYVGSLKGAYRSSSIAGLPEVRWVLRKVK